MSIDLTTADLPSWLAYLESLHPTEIELSLTRVNEVKERLGLNPCCPVVTIGGTNGKGSTATLLATILTQAGYKVGLYTSPHLVNYNERVRIHMQPVSDQMLIAAFTQINCMRQDISLTYFEFATLAAMHIFLQEKVEVIVLEVGLGGRLDATNIFSADIAAVVNVDMDHEAYLGDTRDKIGFEKAGIFRPGKPALCADPHPPHSLRQYAEKIGAKFEVYLEDFTYRKLTHQWSFHHHECHKYALPFPALCGKNQLINASLALAILDHLQARVPVAMGDIKAGLVKVELAGRFQVLPGRPTVVLDVGHNPHAIKTLSHNLEQMGFYEKTYAVFGMMQDKNIQEVIRLLNDKIDQWYVAAPAIARAASPQYLIEQFKRAEVATYQVYPSIVDAYHAAYSRAFNNDRILIFGSFYTVAEGLQAYSHNKV